MLLLCPASSLNNSNVNRWEPQSCFNASNCFFAWNNFPSITLPGVTVNVCFKYFIYIYIHLGQVAILQDERNSLLAENDVLTDRANQLDSFEDPNTTSGKKHSQLQQQLEAVQEENFRSVFCTSYCLWWSWLNESESVVHIHQARGSER